MSIRVQPSLISFLKMFIQNIFRCIEFISNKTRNILTATTTILHKTIIMSTETTMIKIGRKSTNKFGDYYSISNNGSEFQFTTEYCPFFTYGISTRYPNSESCTLYIDEDPDNYGALSFLQMYAQFEEQLQVAFTDHGITSNVSTRLKYARDSATRRRLTVKLAWSNKKDKILSEMIRFMSEEPMDITKLSVGKKFEIYPVISIDSVFISRTHGIVPQLRIKEAYLVEIKETRVPLLDINVIRRRYETSMLTRKITHLKFEEEK